ncbi:uncharacterized protein IL334_006636 [Kwoniella shivajii]|uniref:G-patch domain-containing protein n=1 Tax=Kwoniella shivajii TaxID=564305 RepID=A0ABZ1D746_9TREE|nr:hypothetical protein IL334_006636 [Kwoniella shivajii]
MTASSDSSSSDTWIYDHLHKVYFHPLTNTYAVPDPVTGQWSYIPSGEFNSTFTSTSALTSTTTNTLQVDSGSENGIRKKTNLNGEDEKEEGEIEDDMGWGGLMDPSKLAQIQIDKEKAGSSKQTSKIIRPTQNQDLRLKEKHPAYTVSEPAPYDDPTLYSYPTDNGIDAEDELGANINGKSKESPNHILRLVVMTSNCLESGQVGLVDTRENGIQLGRDRCEKGGQARIRLKEMEVSKTHCVIYWGKGNDHPPSNGEKGEIENEENWWIVDLGSTHGTFILPPNAIPDVPSTIKSKTKRNRLSEPKHSSKPFKLTHLSRLLIGTTTFEIHIHPSWPCDLCSINNANEIPLDDGQPKLKPASEEVPSEGKGEHGYTIAMDSSQKKQNRELKRKLEMALLKENLMKKNGGGDSIASLTIKEQMDGSQSPKREYLDRSAMRRRLHPPSPPSRSSTTSKAVTPEYTSTTISHDATGVNALSIHNNGPSKFASSLLANQGWTPGSGLGKSNQGRSEPILAEMRNSKKGLGAKGSKAIVDNGDGDWKIRGKQRRWDEISKEGFD